MTAAEFKAFLVDNQGCLSLANLPAIQKYFNLGLAEMIRIFREVEKL